MTIYLGRWDNLKDMCADFSISSEGLKDCNILVACYDTPDYEGYAFVLYEENGKLYEVHGSHCSCYGLEGQFEPEETSVASIKHRLKEGNLGLYMGGSELDVLNALRRVRLMKKFRLAA